MKIYTYIHNIGLILVLLAAFTILVLLQNSIFAKLLFSIGVVFLTIGRFFGPSNDYSLSCDKTNDLTVRRLYRQRIVAVCVLYLSIILLFIPSGFYWGIYLRGSIWFIPFLFFTIIEVYTIFRLSSIERGPKP